MKPYDYTGFLLFRDEESPTTKHSGSGFRNRKRLRRIGKKTNRHRVKENLKKELDKDPNMV